MCVSCCMTFWEYLDELKNWREVGKETRIFIGGEGFGDW